MNQLMRTLLFLPRQISTFAAEIDALHYFVISVTMLGALVVTVIGAFYLVRYRSRGGRPEGLDVTEERTRVPGFEGVPLWLELGVIFGLLGLFVVWWYIGFQQFVRLRVAPERTYDVYVTGKQWMWNFAYTNGTRSSGTLYVPANTPVKLIMTSRDVIHSFFVPEFRVKQDVIPGRYTTLWFEANTPGTYPILCTEYCGLAHSTMRGQVVVVDPRDWNQDPENVRFAGSELARVRAQDDEQPSFLAEMGERASVEYGCLRCHTTDGTPHIGPTWAGVYGTVVPLQEGEVLVDEAYLTESMMVPLEKIRRGFAPVMPSYFGILPPAEAAAIVEYIKALRDVKPAPDEQIFSPAGEVPTPRVPSSVLQPRDLERPRRVQDAPVESPEGAQEGEP